MVEELVLVRKDVSRGAEIVDGIYAVLINTDDGDTEAVIRLEAVTACNLGGQHDVIPPCRTFLGYPQCSRGNR